MHLDDRWDILVVGAGPAGSSAAGESARAGARTLLIDAKMQIGERPHCGEFVPSRLFGEFDLDRSSIIQNVRFMETRIVDSWKNDEEATGARTWGTPESTSGEKWAETISPGYVIDRARFDRDLARSAAACGATVMCATRLVRREIGRWIVRQGPHEIALQARYVIAADGALSTVARAMGMDHPEVLTGIQIEAPLVGRYDRTFVFLHKEIVEGYGWVFPKGSVANVGVGISRGENLSPEKILGKFVTFLNEAKLIKPGRLARSGGTIPISGLRSSLVRENVVFCGDAAGLTHPVTGAGIPQAIFSGILAGQTVSEALKAENQSLLGKYEDEIRGRYGKVLEHARLKRELMAQEWKKAEFQSVCNRTWIGFKGYKKRERRGASCRTALTGNT